MSSTSDGGFVYDNPKPKMPDETGDTFQHGAQQDYDKVELIAQAMLPGVQKKLVDLGQKPALAWDLSVEVAIAGFEKKYGAEPKPREMPSAQTEGKVQAARAAAESVAIRKSLMAKKGLIHKIYSEGAGPLAKATGKFLEGGLEQSMQNARNAVGLVEGAAHPARALGAMVASTFLIPAHALGLIDQSQFTGATEALALGKPQFGPGPGMKLEVPDKGPAE